MLTCNIKCPHKLLTVCACHHSVNSYILATSGCAWPGTAAVGWCCCCCIAPIPCRVLVGFIRHMCHLLANTPCWRVFVHADVFALWLGPSTLDMLPRQAWMCSAGLWH